MTAPTASPTGDTNQIRVLLVDDEKLLRTALAALLSFETDISVIGQAADGFAALTQCEKLHPDVVVLDVEMPGRGGLDAAKDILDRHPGQAIVLLTRHARPGVLRQALNMGVLGFAAKSTDPEELARIIRRVHAGGRYVDSETSTAAMMDDSPLTEREVEVLRVAATGVPVRDIAKQVFLAEGTVRNYLSSAMAKLGAETRFEAARLARERGWL